jgi:hypothetical protein
LSAIAARRAPAGLARFQQQGVRALLGQMQRRARVGAASDGIGRAGAAVAAQSEGPGKGAATCRSS